MKRLLKKPGRPSRAACRLFVCLIVGSAGLVVIGCGKTGLDTKIIHGTVTVGGEKVEVGRVRFVPIEGTKGPASLGQIVDGQYRIEARGGIPVGKHRVEVNAFRKTGRKVLREGRVMVDEKVSIGPKEYSGPRSPLIKEVLADSDGRIDIEIPGP